MRERFFEHEKIDDKKAIQRDLEDAGVKHPSEWREVLDLETPLEGEESGTKVGAKEKESGKSPEQPPELGNFAKILHYVEGPRTADRSKIEAFASTKDGLARLELLKSMSLTEVAESIRDFGFTPGAYWYLSGRLDFYQKFIDGKAVKRYQTQEWNSEKGQYEDVVKEEVIDSSSATPETVKLGLFRDAMFASMIGTPEMAIFKISNRQCKERKISTAHFPLVKGYHSGIHESSIGYTYPLLRKTYEKARASVEGRMKGQNREMDEQQIEHRAVMLASSWLTESMNYNDPGRSQHSPYASSNEEAIAWARLGEQVKKQLRGMRRKIQSVDLHGIERFIGKSGVDKYDPERKRLFGQIKFLKEGVDQEKKQEFATKENSFAVQKQQVWHEREIERLTQKFEKSKAEVEKANLPDEEKELQLQSVLARHEDAVAKLRTSYQTGVDNILHRDIKSPEEYQRIEDEYKKRKEGLELRKGTTYHNFIQGDVPVDGNDWYLTELQKLDEWHDKEREKISVVGPRTPEQLLTDLEERQKLVEGRHEKRKSLAQKALDLHFRFNHGKKIRRREYEERPYAGVIDWINNAPFGTIKRVHRALQKGVSEQTAMMLALAEIHGDKEKGISRADLDVASFTRNLAKAGHGHQVVENFEKIEGVKGSDHRSIVTELAKAGVGDAVVRNFEKFGGIRPDEHKDVVMELIRAGAGGQVVENLEKFPGITPQDHNEIVFECIKAGSGYQIPQNFQKFTGIPVEEHRRIVLESIKGGGGYQVISNLEKFRGIKDADHRDVVLEIIKAGAGYYLNYNNALDKFKGLEEGLRQVIKAGKYEALPHVLEAGFTIEEITRFPFLISPLVTKK